MNRGPFFHEAGWTAANSILSSDSDWSDAWYTQRTAGKTTHRTYDLRQWQILVDYENGICAGNFGGFDALCSRKNNKYTSANAQFTLGSAHMSVDGKGLLYDDGTWNPQLQLRRKQKLRSAQLKAGLISEPRMCMPGLKASVGVGVAKGAAKAVIKKDEVTLGEIELAAYLTGE